MRQKQTFSHETEIDLGAILYLLVRRIWLIILATVICASGAFVYAQAFAKKEYLSVTRMIVLYKNSDSPYFNQDDFVASGLMASDCREIIKSRYVVSKAIDELEADVSVDELQSHVSVWVPDNSRIVQISVIADDPYLAQNLANTIREVASERMVEVMNVDAVNLIDEADFHGTPVKPKVASMVFSGAGIGAVIAILIIIAKFLLDDTIIIPDDVDTYLELSVLGVIPFDDGKDKKRKRKNHKKKR